MSCTSKSVRSRRRSVSSVTSNTSHSSIRSLGHTKSKMMKSEHEESLSSSMMSSSRLADETLESLGNSNSDESDNSSVCDRNFLKRVKEMFTEEDYKIYRKAQKRNPKTRKMQGFNKKMEYITKNKLLSIIHLALVLCGSELQLSDLLRFIREGHLSFAKITHFLPFNFKFPKKDYSYLDAKSDGVMPTHLKQRQLLSNLSRFLDIDSIPTPNLNKLVDRYCIDLNLPDEIGNLAKKITTNWMPEEVTLKINLPVPSFEAWAMVSIIFVMKLLFGLNDYNELELSELARQRNKEKKGNEREMFVFEDWQRFIECRKCVLTKYHYPTQEQVLVEGYEKENSKMFLNRLERESKDWQMNQRFIPYKRYYISENVVTSIEEMLKELTEPLRIISCEFEASLTPQSLYTYQILINELSSDFEGSDEVIGILRQDFRNCCVEFPSDLEELRSDIDCSAVEKTLSSYWISHFSTKVNSCLSHFLEEELDEIPENFLWLLCECSRMVEMNVRDVYEEFSRLEKKIINFSKKKRI